MVIMNTALTIAYFVEVLKGVRTLGQYLILAVSLIGSCVLARLVYQKKPASTLIRYILAVGFLVFYSYLMFITSVNLAFCYILVAYIVLIVYVDIKFSVMIGAYGFLLNIALMAKRLMTTELTGKKSRRIDCFIPPWLWLTTS